ncbi:MAG: hypothetical protein FWC95_01290 [Defluviitaleaceae bacterium]|nr:hypothetical protein [Defluviitaleaceae bacterium]
MVQISEVNIISVDKSEEIWEIEGEIMFESDLSTPFSTAYYPDDDEFTDLTIEMIPGRFDNSLLKQMIVDAANEFED